MNNRFYSKVLVLTSCLVPNIHSPFDFKFPSLDLAAKQLASNLSDCYRTGLFDVIILVDASPAQHSCSAKMTLANHLSHYFVSIPDSIHVIHFCPSEDQLKLIASCGKGFSETLMVLHAIKVLVSDLRLNHGVILKLSGRYRLMFPNLFFNFVLASLEAVDFLSIRSFLFSRTLTVFYAFRFSSSIVVRLLSSAASLSSDQSGVYIEHTFYSHIFRNSLIVSKPLVFFPVFRSDVRSGSHGRRLSLFVQFLHFLACLF